MAKMEKNKTVTIVTNNDEREKALEAALSQIHRQYGNGSIIDRKSVV